MDVNWLRYKQVVLNDRPVFYCPDKDLINRLGHLFKDLNVFGFGKYQETGCWYMLMSSSGFPENHHGVPIIVPISEVFRWAAPKSV